MSTRDRIVAAASWWFALIAALGLLLRADPPLHPDARRHCLFGLVGNLALALLYIAVAVTIGRSGEVGAALTSCLTCLWGAVALANTAAAAMGRGPFFTTLTLSGEDLL